MISDPNSNIFTKGMSQLWHTASQLWHRVTIVTSLEILVLNIVVSQNMTLHLHIKIVPCPHLTQKFCFDLFFYFHVPSLCLFTIPKGSLRQGDFSTKSVCGLGWELFNGVKKSVSLTVTKYGKNCSKKRYLWPKLL